MPTNDERSASIAKLRDLIKDIKIAMLTTVGHDGIPHSRPMATQQADFEGTLWFFTGEDTAKAGEVAEYRAVNLAYADPDHHRYVSMSGPATLVRDRAKAEQLWNPAYRAWFPKGLDDPTLVLLRVDVEQAEYWDPESSRMQMLAGFVKAVTTGRRMTGGDHEKVVLDTSGN